MEEIKSTETKVSFVGKILLLIIVLYLGVIAQKVGSKYVRQTLKSSNNQSDKVKAETKLAFKL